jgi:2-desacetyl-2-hydroxyethyl bacteriochlorophyllide A dehydrogenase
MKAVLLTAPGVLEYVDAPDPVLEADDDVLVRVGATSICGSDTHGYTGHGGRRVPPLIMGHETSGRVEAIGAGVSNVAVGDRIFVLPMLSCLRCPPCRAGAYDECTGRLVYGADLPGAFADLVRIKARAAVPIPDAVSFVQGALIEQTSVVVKGVSRATIAAGDSVAVVGAGPIGLLAVMLLNLHRPRDLVVVEPNEERRRKAVEFGATLAIDPTQVDPRTAVAEVTAGTGVHVCVEAAGITSSVAAAIDVTRPGGTMVWLGNTGRIVEIDEFKVVWNQLTIVASVGMTRASVRRAIELIESGAIPVERLVSLAVPLADGVAAFERTVRDMSVIKTVLLP